MTVFARSIRRALTWALIFASFPIAAADCEARLEGSVVVPAAVPRMPKDRLLRNAYLFVEGAEALTHLSPARVLTQKGEDFLLVLDSRRAYHAGPRTFATQVLGITDDPANREWLDRFEARFASYLDEDQAVKNLSSLTSEPNALGLIDQIFFLRFFSPTFELNVAQRSHLYEGPDKATRLAVVSLRRPRGAAAERLPSVRSPAREPAILRPSIRAARPGTVGPGVWFQLPRTDQIRGVTWSVPGQARPRSRAEGRGTQKWFEKTIPSIAIPKLARTGGDRVLLPYFNRLSVQNLGRPDQTGFVYEIRRRTSDQIETYDIVGETPATSAELLVLNADHAARYLEPADLLKRRSVKQHFPADVYVPAATYETFIESGCNLGGVSISLLRLFELQPEVVAGIEALTTGQRLFARYLGDDVRGSDGLVRSIHGRSFVFTRGPDGRTYLISFLETGRAVE